MLDTPPAEHLPTTINNIWKLGFRPSDVKIILLSHEHTDHYGSAMGLKHYTGAKIYLSRTGAQDFIDHPAVYDAMESEFNPLNVRVRPDALLDDGDVVRLGNTSVRCVATPGHSRGTMSHFWTVYDNDGEYRAGIFGGGGFLTLSEERLAQDGLDLSWRDVFASSIDKVWDEPVDIMLGNHPFHSDTLSKRARQLDNDPDAFVDPSEWHRFLTELKDSFAIYRSMAPEEIRKSFENSAFDEYSGRFLQQLNATVARKSKNVAD